MLNLQLTKSKLTTRRFWSDLALHSAAIIVPVWLVLAHFDHGADLPQTTAIFSLGLLLIFALVLATSDLQKLPIGMGAIGVIFLVWLLAGGFGDWHQARMEVQALAAGGAIAGTGYLIGRRTETLKRAWFMLILTLLIFALLAFAANFSDASTATRISGRAFEGRLTGGFGSPNTVATLFAIGALLACGRIFLRLHDGKMSRLTRSNRVNYLAQSEGFTIGLLIFAMTCLVLTRSRAGLLFGLIFLTGLIAIELYRTYRRGRLGFLKRKRVLLPLFGLMSGVVGLAIIGGLTPQHATALGSDVLSRFDLFGLYWDMWARAPLFGHGLGSFNALNDQATTLETADRMVANGAAHNLILQWLIQQGVVGLSLMSAILIALHVPIIRALRVTSSVPRHFLRVTLAVSGLVLLHGMADYAMEIPSVMWTYAFILGIATGLAHRANPGFVGKPE